MNTSTATHTLVAVFNDRQAADAAVADLRSNGFSAAETLSRDAVGTGTTTGTGHHEGGIVGWFKHLFGEDDTADRTSYQDAYDRGQYLVTAYVQDEQVDRVADILNQHSPTNIERDADADDYEDTNYAGESSRIQGTQSVQSRTAGSAVAGANATRAARNTISADENRTIPVVQEELKVGKRSVERGGVRIYSRIVEQPVEEEVRLREERVRVDRSPANRPTQAGDLQAGREQVYEVREYAEEPVVSKQARVVEEVRVGKEATERVEKVRDTVRRTEVNVENLGTQGATATGTTSTGATAPRGTSTAVPDISATGTGDADDYYYRQNFATQAEYSGLNYDDYAPAYRYGETIAGDPRYSGRSFEDIEPQLRSEYAQRYPNSSWDRAKAAVRTGWNRLSAKAHNV